MPRANRHYLPGYIWHITHRCHKREFLLKFDKDKSIAISSKKFVGEDQTKLGIKAKGRNVVVNNEAYELRESKIPYSSVFDPKKVRLRQNNSYFGSSF